MRRSLLGAVASILGAAIGVALTLAAGTVCVNRTDDSYCGLNFLVWDFSTPMAIVLSAALGAVVGFALALVAGVVFGWRPRS